MEKNTKIEKEFVKITIKDKSQAIKIDDTDTQDILDEPSCGNKDIIDELSSNKKNTNRLLCYKCKKNKSQLYNRTEYVCRECFFELINHKFRSNLRVSCKIKNTDTVLICVSGKSNSMSMLNLFNYTFFRDTKSNRKLYFKTKILYIDDSFLYTNQSRSENILKISEIAKNSGFEFDIINLEHSISINPKELIEITNSQLNIPENLKDLNLSEENHEKIEKLKEIITLLSRNGAFIEDFIFFLKRKLMFYYALKNNFAKIVLANTSQTSSTNIFNNIIKGRGFTLRDDMGALDSHFLNGKIQILYPMKDFVKKEILFYNHLFKVEILLKCFLFSQVSNNLPYNGNSKHLINSFFNRLQDRFHSTVPTVACTAEKLKIKEKTSYCEFCLDYKDEVLNLLEIGSMTDYQNDKIFQMNCYCFGCKRMFSNADYGSITSILKKYEI